MKVKKHRQAFLEPVFAKSLFKVPPEDMAPMLESDDADRGVEMTGRHARIFP
jgi:hypothetical protein